MQLIEVINEERFYTAFDFTSKFLPALGSFQLKILAVSYSQIVTPVKLQSIYLFNPGQHSQGDGFLFQIRAL